PLANDGTSPLAAIGAPRASGWPIVRIPSATVVSPRYVLPVGLLNRTSPRSSLVRSCPAPVSPITPVTVRTVPDWAPMDASWSRVTGPAQVLLPTTFHSAPRPAVPRPLRVTGSAIESPAAPEISSDDPVPTVV